MKIEKEHVKEYEILVTEIILLRRRHKKLPPENFIKALLSVSLLNALENNIALGKLYKYLNKESAHLGMLFPQGTKASRK